jgi:hypothetical protein
MLALLSGTLVRLLPRCGKATQQSIHDGACMQQIREQSEAVTGQLSWCGALRSVKIRPFGGNERSTAVGQDQEQLRTTLPMNAPVYGEALTFEGMMRSSDGDAWRKILVMGSVSGFPSIRFHTPAFSRRWEVGLRTLGWWDSSSSFSSKTSWKI